MKATRALITGIEGFAGGYLARHLLQEGYEVFGTTFGKPPLEISSLLTEGVKRVLQIDIRKPEALVEALGEEIPDQIYHLAALTYLPEVERNPLVAFDTNEKGTFLLLEAVRKQSPDSRVIFISSSEVYGHAGPGEIPLSEESPTRPPNLYAATKLCGEQWCHYFHTAYDLDVIILRPFNHIGPGQTDRFVASNFAHQIARIEAGLEKPILHVGNLESIRDFTDVRDMVRAYRMAANSASSGSVLQICSGNGLRIGDILEKLLSFAKKRIDIRIDPMRMRGSEVHEFWGVCDRLKALTGWKQEFSIDQTLQDTLADWREKVQQEMKEKVD